MGDFNYKKAERYFDISQLPLVYERGNDPKEMQRWMPDGDIDVRFIRHKNSTAVIVHDKSLNEITVAYDGSLEDAGDWVDDMNVIPTPLFGEEKVRSGYKNAVMKENEEGEYLIDEVRDAIKEMAKNAESPINLNIVGFSKAGAMSIMTASNWLKEKFPADTPNLNLKSVYSFGSPPLGNDAFVAEFEKNMSQAGAEIWRVDYGADPTPDFTFGVMEHPGRQVLLVPLALDSGDKTIVIVDPSEEIRNNLKSILSDMDSDYHNYNKYEKAFDTIDPTLTHYHLDKINLPTINGVDNKPIETLPTNIQPAVI